MSEEKRPWDNDPNAGSFGAWLRRQREVREISLNEISSESKISYRYLEAFEQDNFEILPAPIFSRGFLREYARFVGLDPDEVVNYYLSAVPVEEAAEESPRVAPISSVNRSGWWPLLAVLVVLSGALGAFYWFSARTSEDSAVPDSVPPTAGSSVEVAETVEPEAQSLIRLTMDFRQNCWVKVVVDGERKVSELRVQGESLKVSAESEIRLTLGNVSGVTLELNGQPLPLAVKNDEELVIDAASLTEIGLAITD